jgi:hypothetical protein
MGFLTLDSRFRGNDVGALWDYLDLFAMQKVMFAEHCFLPIAVSCHTINYTDGHRYPLTDRTSRQ